MNSSTTALALRRAPLAARSFGERVCINVCTLANNVIDHSENHSIMHTGEMKEKCLGHPCRESDSQEMSVLARTV